MIFNLHHITRHVQRAIQLRPNTLHIDFSDSKGKKGQTNLIIIINLWLREREREREQMVLRATATKFASSNSTPPTERRDGRTRTTRVMEVGRRGLLLSTMIATSQVNDSRTQLLQSKNHHLLLSLSYLTTTFS